MDNQKKSNQEFDRYAANYEELLSEPSRDWFASVDFFQQRKLDLLLELLATAGKKPAELDWMDFGCGRGTLLGLGAPYFQSVTGCDVSAEMLAASGNPILKLQERPDRAPYEAESLDLVTAVCVYHHVEKADRATLTQEIARVLRPGGWFAIIEHNPYNPLTQLVVKRSPVDENAILLTAFEAAEWQRRAGLTCLPAKYFLYVPAFAYPALGGIEKYTQWLPLGGQYVQIGVKPAK